MIYDSNPWKLRLNQHGDQLEQLMQGAVVSDGDLFESNCVLAEEAIMAGAFAIRKLMDSEKLSEEVEALKLRCIVHPATPRMAPDWSGVGRMWPSFFDRHKVEKYFDLETSSDQPLKLRDFLNQVIHSLIFELGVEESGHLDFLWVCSDHRAKNDLGLVSLPLQEVVRAFRAVAADDVEHAIYFRNTRTWEMTSRRFQSKSAYDKAFAAHQKRAKNQR